MHVSPITVCNQFQQIERYKSAVFFQMAVLEYPLDGREINCECATFLNKINEHVKWN